MCVTGLRLAVVAGIATISKAGQSVNTNANEKVGRDPALFDESQGFVTDPESFVDFISVFLSASTHKNGIHVKIFCLFHIVRIQHDGHSR